MNRKKKILALASEILGAVEHGEFMYDNDELMFLMNTIDELKKEIMISFEKAD